MSIRRKRRGFFYGELNLFNPQAWAGLNGDANLMRLRQHFGQNVLRCQIAPWLSPAEGVDEIPRKMAISSHGFPKCQLCCAAQARIFGSAK